MPAVLARVLLGVLLSAVPLAAQAPDDAAIAKQYLAALQAVADGRAEEAVPLYEALLERFPEEATLAYNLACAHALAGDGEQALDWLERSATWGFATLDEDNVEWAREGDPDLRSLRGTARFAEILASMERARAELQADAAVPALYRPESLSDDAPPPLLVVLHDAGSRKEAVVTGPWRAIADELGAILLAPSGGFSAPARPAGRAWFADSSAYLARPWKAERTAAEAVRRFRLSQPVDRERILLAGEGEGGLLAFHLAVSTPGLYRGVLVLDAPVLLEPPPGRLADAARVGLHVAVRVDREAFPSADPATLEAALAETARRLSAWGLAGSATFFAGSEAPGREAFVVETLRAL